MKRIHDEKTALRLFELSDQYGLEFDWSTYNHNEDRHEKAYFSYISCSDFFFWGCADAVSVTKDNIDLLESSLQDALKASESDDTVDVGRHGGLLFCARYERLRPQGAYYKYLPDSLHEMFNAVGEDRSVDFGNPYPPSSSVLKPFVLPEYSSLKDPSKKPIGLDRMGEFIGCLKDLDIWYDEDIHAFLHQGRPAYMIDLSDDSSGWWRIVDEDVLAILKKYADIESAQHKRVIETLAKGTPMKDIPRVSIWDDIFRDLREIS